MRFEFINMSWKQQGLYSVEVLWTAGDRYSERVKGFRVQKEDDGSWTALERQFVKNGRPPKWVPHEGFRTKKAAAEFVTFELHDNDKPESYKE